MSNGPRAELYLNGKKVGQVSIEGFSSTWGFGQFQAQEEFLEFAHLFGRWSDLMHAEDDRASVSPGTSEQLRHVESAIDALHAELDLRGRRAKIAQVNIDGALIEWKTLEKRRY